MKRLFTLVGTIALLVSIISGCEKISLPQATTYTFQDNLGVYQVWAKEFDTSAYNISVEFQFLEYYERNRVNVQSLLQPEKGKVYKFTANEKAEYLTVFQRTKIQSKSYSSINTEDTNYSAVVYYLKPGGNIDIVLDGSTMISPKEPIK